MKMRQTFIAIISAVLISGCASTAFNAAGGASLAPTGKFDVGSFIVNLPSDLNSIKVRTDDGDRGYLLTQDGPSLDSIYLFSDIQDGDAILKQFRKENPVPKYSDEMFDLELVEFLIDTISKGTDLRVRSSNVRPGSFLGEEAILFDINGVSSRGLNMTGSALMSATDAGLDVAFYIAPQEYYAPRIKASFDSILGSAVSDGDSS